MESRAVVGMLQMTQFMEDDAVAQGFGKPHKIEIQIDIALGRTASPVG